ncbi:MAG TPA: hypothetical protein VFF68_00655 [Anaerolineaceae bacterium]|nr:hypothetical protein [Anaerolineaceae bacterium]
MGDDVAAIEHFPILYKFGFSRSLKSYIGFRQETESKGLSAAYRRHLHPLAPAARAGVRQVQVFAQIFKKGRKQKKTPIQGRLSLFYANSFSEICVNLR